MKKVSSPVGFAMLGALAFAILLVIVGFGSFSTTPKADASSPGGTQTSLATSSALTLGTTAVQVTATSTCASRVITTLGQPAMFTFGDLGQTPNATTGHFQAASTTVAYDSGQYGCGLVKGYGFIANTQAYISEFNGFR